MSQVAARRLAWSLCGVTGAATLLDGALAVLIAGASGPVPSDLEGGSADALWAGVSVGFAVVGALVASRCPDNAIGWIFCGSAVGFTFSGLAESYAIYALFAERGSLPAGRTMAWLSVWVWVPGGVALFTFFFLLFPTGRLPTARWRPVPWFAIAASILLVLGTAFAPGPFEDLPEVTNPYGLSGAAGETLSAAYELGWLLLVITLVASATSLVLRFRRARGEQRAQLKWVATAGVFLVISFLSWGLWEGLAPLGILVTIVAAGAAILRYRLYDIDVVINRALVYTALTATLAGLYVGSVLLLQLALSPGSDLAVAGSTLAVAALFRPARSRIQELVDRRFYRRKYDAQRTLAGFAARLRDEVDLDALAVELRRVTVETMQPAHLSLWLRETRR